MSMPQPETKREYICHTNYPHPPQLAHLNMSINYGVAIILFLSLFASVACNNVNMYQEAIDLLNGRSSASVAIAAASGDASDGASSSGGESSESCGSSKSGGGSSSSPAVGGGTSAAVAHTVTFMYGNGSSTHRSVPYGSPVPSLPGSNRTLEPPGPGLYINPVPAHEIFGWYTSSSGGTEWTSASIVTEPIALHARWTLPGLIEGIGGDQVAEAIAYIVGHPSPSGYTLIALDGTVNPGALTMNSTGADLIIRAPEGAASDFVHTSPGSPLFTISDGAKLTLGNNVTLHGVSNGTTALVYVNGGTLVMEDGSKITGHKNIASGGQGGGGVCAAVGGTFKISAGTVYGSENTVVPASLKNTASSGAALYAANGGTAQNGIGTTWTDILSNSSNAREETLSVTGGVLQ